MGQTEGLTDPCLVSSEWKDEPRSPKRVQFSAEREPLDLIRRFDSKPPQIHSETRRWMRPHRQRQVPANSCDPLFFCPFFLKNSLQTRPPALTEAKIIENTTHEI